MRWPRSIVLNPFTAPSCKISGLKSSCTRLQNSIFSGPIKESDFQYCAFWWKSVYMLMRKRKQKGFRYYLYYFYWSFSSSTVTVKGLITCLLESWEWALLTLHYHFSLACTFSLSTRRPSSRRMLKVFAMPECLAMPEVLWAERTSDPRPAQVHKKPDKQSTKQPASSAA